MSSSTKDAAKAEAIYICLDDSWWMESIDSPMFQEQLSALSLYCEKKSEEHPDTLVGVVGMAGSSPERHMTMYPTKNLRMISTALNYGNCVRIGGFLRLTNTAEFAVSHLSDFYLGPIKRRIVLFAGGDVCCSPAEAQLLGEELKEVNVACDVISFGDPYKCKREFFDTLIRFADNNNGNCNVCHVPPESSVREALSRSTIFIPCVGGGSLSAQSSSLQCHDKREAIDIYVKPPSDGADLKTDCPFCQTVRLTLEEKGVSYKTHFIDLLNKPKGMIPTQNLDETLPLIKFHDGTWVSNSEVIVEMIDKKYQGRSLVSPPRFAHLGLKILPKIGAFLKANDENDGSKKALLDELQELDKHLSEHGPYLNGKEITAFDLSLAPKLYHLVNACSFYKDNWNVLQDLPNVQTYIEFLFKRDSFTITKPCPQNVIEGWRQRLAVNEAIPNYSFSSCR